MDTVFRSGLVVLLRVGQGCVLDTTNSPNDVCAIGPYLVHKTDCVVLRQSAAGGQVLPELAETN